MKNLANCKPSEFLAQTNRIRKAVAKWLTDTDIINIRRRIPKFEVAGKDCTDSERAEIAKRNKATMERQVRENLSAIMDAVMEQHPDETLEVLALVCFVEPEQVDDYPIADYLNAISELISDDAVIGFFTSLASWVKKNTSNASKA